MGTRQRIGYVQVNAPDQSTVCQLAGVDVDRVFKDNRPDPNPGAN